METIGSVTLLVVLLLLLLVLYSATKAIPIVSIVVPFWGYLIGS